MSANNEWDAAAPLRTGATATTIAAQIRSGWNDDVCCSLTDDVSIYDLGGEIEQIVVRDARNQILKSLESVITSSGLGMLNTTNITIKWDVSCVSEENSYHWDPALSCGFLSCIASVHPSSPHHPEAGLLASVQMRILTRAPVKHWSTATNKHLDEAINRDRKERLESWDKLGVSVPVITTQVRNLLLESQDEGFEIWENSLDRILQEDRMCVSAYMDATVQRSSVKVDATYFGWYWGNDENHELQPVRYVVTCSRQRDGSWQAEFKDQE